ncbi:16963_t:CDS:2 [Funneliformis geosporum]|uniref:5439_t:CDS:1 n=1 Tax=Funneliformis geosporum TaxID=1117311 RepID=A0A9W4WVR1_9GLOM|nr:16963_t:CDS:2 [Funneliformis geosporum]CAI2189338.1 5439_t:CDS:2 [Funneliformis geosporum]
MAGNSRSSSPNLQLLLNQNDIQNNPEQQSSDSSTMADITTNTRALPTSTSNLNSASNTKGYNICPGPRSSALRPATLRKQRSRRPSFQSDQVTPDMRPVLHLFDVFSQKIYIEGYLCKQDITNSNSDWIEYYVELCGPILSFWKTVNDPNSEITKVSQTPSVLNISYCSIDLSQNNSMDQRMHVFFLDSGQGENFYLQTPDDQTLISWVNAIRLSCFEGSRLQEVYTATLIKRPGLKDFGNGTVLVKGKLEGYLQVQFSGNVESKKYWVVVADHRVEEKKKKDLAFTRGQALFYETKRSKKPFMTVANVLQTYAIYPENPSLIDKTVTFRVEGTLFLTKPTENKPGDFVILTTDSLNEVTKWLFGFFDSFKLYGRPKELLYDFKNPISPFFSVPTGRNNTKLFLDLNEIEHVEVHESLADVKSVFAEILRQSYNLQQQQSPDNPQQLLTSVNQQKKLNIQSLPQIVTDGLPDDYVLQRAISVESTTTSTSSISPSTLRPASQSSRTNSMTGGSQKGSIPTSPVSPHSPLTPNTMSSQEQPKKRSKKPAKQLASSDESEDQQDNYSPNESENSDDDVYDDPTLLKNTQENSKIIEKIKSDEQINIGSSFGTNENSDFMSEIMTAVAERKDEDASTKPKRRVSFKNQPAKQKGKNKQRLAPLPSDSEDSGDSEEESSVTKSDENNSDEDSSEDSSLKNKIFITKPGHKGNNKKTKARTVPQPSDSSDDNELNDDDKKLGTQPQPQSRTYRQSPPYGSGFKQPRGSIISNNTYNVDRNYPQVQQNLYPQGNFENDLNDNIPLGRNPVRSRNILPSNNIAADDYQFEMSTEGLDIDFSAINFDSEPANNTIEIVDKNKKGKNDISSDESETKSLTSEEEPLAALVEEGVGFNANFSRQNLTPRSISPNYLPNQRWGGLPITGDYVENMGYPPIDNRRSVATPLIRGGEYNDEDYIGGRPRSLINPGQMMAGRRRVSNGQLDYTRESLYLDDSYDDRGQFQTPSHFRPMSLIDSRPPSQQLSAREQEFLARETGAPLINLQERQKDPQTGLVGAITARENQRRAKAMMVERERDLLYNRQSYTGLPMGVDPRSSRFLGSQQYLETTPGQRGSYYESYVPYIQSDDEDDDVPLAVGNPIPPTVPPTQSRQSRAMKNRQYGRFFAANNIRTLYSILENIYNFNI